MTAKLIDLADIPPFAEARNIRPRDVTDPLREAVRKLHEADELEPFVRTILSDNAATPHGPAEIADILTHRISFQNSTGLGAFILKGRSFRTVRPKDVAHQIYRLEKINGLHFAAFGATGTVLDSAKEHFVSTCRRLKIGMQFLTPMISLAFFGPTVFCVLATDSALSEGDVIVATRRATRF